MDGGSVGGFDGSVEWAVDLESFGAHRLDWDGLVSVDDVRLSRFFDVRLGEAGAGESFEVERVEDREFKGRGGWADFECDLSFVFCGRAPRSGSSGSVGDDDQYWQHRLSNVGNGSYS